MSTCESVLTKENRGGTPEAQPRQKQDRKMRLLTEIDSLVDVADALREARLRLHTMAESPPISPASVLAVAEYIASVERAVMDEHWDMEDMPVTIIPGGARA